MTHINAPASLQTNVFTANSSPNHNPRTACVIMASGVSKRFGSNKLLADFLGQPLICRSLDATENLFDIRVVVTRHQAVSDLCLDRGVKVVLHNFPYRSDTVRLGLEAIGDADFCLFCPADQPLLRRDTLAALLAHAQTEPDCIWRPAYEGTPGAPILFPRRTFPELRSLPEGKGGGMIAKKYPERVRLLPVRDQYELIDADTPETLAYLAARQK